MSQVQKEPDQAKKLRDLMNQPTLPSRSQVHRRKKQRIKFKLSFPMIRLLLIMFIVLVIVAVSYSHIINR